MIEENNIVKINIHPDSKMGEYLDFLLETEIYGNSREEVIKQLILRSMEDALLSDKINKLSLNINNYPLPPNPPECEWECT